MSGLRWALAALGRRLGAIGCVLAAFSGALVLPLASADDAASTQDKIRRLQKDMQRLERWLDDARQQRKGGERELRDSEKEIGEVTQAIRQNRRAIADHETELAGLQDKRAQLLAQKVRQQETLANQLVAAYRSGRQDRLKLMLNQEQPDTLSRLLHYYEYLNQARLQALQAYEGTLLALDEVEDGAQARRQTLEAEQQALKDKQQRLRAAHRERETALQSLKVKISDKNQQLKSLAEDRKRLDKVLIDIQRSLQQNALLRDSQDFVQLKGKLHWPARGRLLSRFGSRAEGALKEEGIFIGAGEGTAVQAVHHGRVVFSDWLRGYGLLLIVDHGGGYMSLYGHNQSLLKETGDWVSANEQIATVGRSGGRSDAGLYFALRYKGRAQDPGPWLVRRRG